MISGGSGVNRFLPHGRRSQDASPGRNRRGTTCAAAAAPNRPSSPSATPIPQLTGTEPPGGGTPRRAQPRSGTHSVCQSVACVQNF
jgi:hypothetical protein